MDHPADSERIGFERKIQGQSESGETAIFIMDLERGCVEDQPQPWPNRSCASKFRTTPGLQRCCDWLSAQSRSTKRELLGGELA